MCSCSKATDDDLVEETKKCNCGDKQCPIGEEYQDWGETVSTAKMEDYLFSTPEGAIEKSKEIGFDGEIHDSTLADGTKLYSPAKTEDEFITWYRKNDSDAEEELGAMEAAEYQGRKVKLNKPFRTPKEKKKFAVYVQNAKGTVVIVRFGDPNMEIKRDDPKRRKAFRDRHNCAEKKDKTTAGYWSCRQWSTNKVEANSNISTDTVANDMTSCGCGGSVEAAEPIPTDEETHEQYMSRCQEAGYTEAECMEAHSNHDFGEDSEEASYHNDSCPAGKEMKNGKCVRVAVTCEIDIDSVEVRIEASTGLSIVRISGVAFHDGVNKNSWGIRPELAARLSHKMIGADVTLNHPEAQMGRFTRNMDGGVNEATVGVVTEASYTASETGYEVRYVAEVHRHELFQALESGLWMRPNYGVSIGGTGIPSEIIEASEEGGRPTMWFADEFELDHLAIVHRPAYENASIETAERVEANETIKYQTESNDNYPKVSTMTDETNESTIASDELEALQATIVLREARIAEYEAAQDARDETDRLALVNKASDLGLKNHESFSAETLKTVISSWESSRPAVAKVEMSPAAPATSEPAQATESNEPVVANYLNGVVVKSSESLYARAYNSWAKAYNSVYSGEHTAKLYEDLN